MPRSSDAARLADAAHALRGPLHNIMTWSAVLERYLGDPTPEVRRALEGIQAGARREAELIAELLDGERDDT